MFRRLVARLGVPASRCVLVEDTLQHLKSARSLGIYTVWMQRWLGGGATGLLHREKRRAATGKNERRRGHKPAYVCARISSLRKLAPSQ
jgi:putative hydrolase of the HAD superfamily